VFYRLVAMLGYGVALAADVHGEHFGPGNYSHQEDPVPDQQDDSGCGHCSHGVTHMLGLTNQFHTLPSPLDQYFQTRYLRSPHFLSLRRQLRPPIHV